MKVPYLQKNGKYILKHFPSAKEGQEAFVRFNKLKPRFVAEQQREQESYDRLYQDLVTSKPHKREYDYLGPFRDGFARAKFENKWHFVDENERILPVPEDYCHLEDFIGGIARIRNNDDEVCLINRSGIRTTTKTYDSISKISGSIFSYQTSFYEAYRRSRLFLLDAQGCEVNLDFDVQKSAFAKSCDINDGIILIKYDNGWHKAIDFAGREIFKTNTYSFIGHFNEGRAIAVRHGNKQPVVLDLELRELEPETSIDLINVWWFSDGYIPVKNLENWKQSYLDRAGNLIGNFDLTTGMHAGYAVVGKTINGVLKKAVIDRSFRQICDFVFDEIDNISEGTFAVYQNGKWGYMDNEGKILLEPLFSRVRACERDLFLVSQGDSRNEMYHGKYGIYSRSGKKLTPLVYDSISSFSGNTAIVQLNNKYGLIGLDGREKTQVQYAQLEYFDKGLYLATIGNSSFIIDETDFQFADGRFTNEETENGVWDELL